MHEFDNVPDIEPDYRNEEQELEDEARFNNLVTLLQPKIKEWLTINAYRPSPEEIKESIQIVESMMEEIKGHPDIPPELLAEIEEGKKLLHTEETEWELSEDEALGCTYSLLQWWLDSLHNSDQPFDIVPEEDISYLRVRMSMYSQENPEGILEYFRPLLNEPLPWGIKITLTEKGYLATREL